MDGKFLAKMALAGAFISLPTAGCSTFGGGDNALSHSSSASSKQAASAARKAEKALARGQHDVAVSHAELAVAADMDNIAYRDLLARSYMNAGRLKSAERTLQDVMELGHVDARTVITLALVRMGQGEVESAITLLDTHRSLVPDSDYGLALALAGDSGRAVEILSDAIRGDRVTARTRQNLALAYALDGKWRQARIMAAQDLPQNKVNDQIAQWAYLARPGAYQERFTAMLNVTPVSDQGQPVRLALSNIPARDNAEFQLAQEDGAGAETVATVVVQPTEVMAADASAAEIPEVQVAHAGVPAPEPVYLASATQSGTSPVAGSAPAIEFRPGRVVQPIRASDKKGLVKLALADVPARSGTRGGSHVVQLGAYSSAAGANRAWDMLRDRYAVLSGFSVAMSTVTVEGRVLTRVAAAGFDSRKDAIALCQDIKAKGGDCLVKVNPASAGVRMAGRPPRNIAAR